MKYYVDEMPTEGKCVDAEWHPYPPIVEKTGDYYCQKDNELCDRTEEGCRYLKVLGVPP